MKNMLKMLEKNLMPIAIIIAGVLIGGAFLYVDKTGFNVLSPEKAAQKAVNFINENMMQAGQTASLVSVTKENGEYKLRLKVGENEFDSYVTRNGKLLFVEGIDLDSKSSSAQNGENATQEIPKRDIPDVKLFVMSYCPFGLQAQKMFLPVYKLLGKGTEMGVYFVDYIMHEKQEIDENLRQYCIQKEEKAKYYDYLSCFVKDGNFEKCLSDANINKAKLTTCISETDEEFNIYSQYQNKSTWLNGQFPKFDIYTDLNEKYGVGGSPTIVINDTVVEVNPRSPENFKKIICESFNSPPSECSQTLSNTAFSSGFGEGASSSGTGGCGE